LSGPSATSPPALDVVARHGRLGRRTLLISAITLVSRTAGYAREILSAALFGDRSGVFDAFITAWRVPNLFRRFLGEGALATSLQTSLTEVDARHGAEAGRRLFWSTLRTLTVVLVTVCAAVMLLVAALPDHMPFTGWAWLGGDPAEVRELTVRVMPFVVLVCLAAAIGGGLNVRGHFALPTAGPTLLNAVWIGVLAALGAAYGFDALRPEGETLEMVRWLTWGVLLAGLVQLIVLLPALPRHGLGWRATGAAPPEFSVGLGPWTVLQRSAPLALGAAVYQINVMLDGLMAISLLEDGGPTLHYYANRVQQFPMSMVAVAATSAVFPALTALGHTGRRAELRGLHDRTQRLVLFLAVPASVGLFVLARPIVAVSFERGAFGPEGVERASAALRMLALALVPAGATGLLARTYYALGDFRTPVRISMLVLVANVALNLVFVLGFEMDVDGLALATALTSWGNLALLLPGLRERLDLPPAAPGFGVALARIGAASLACGALAWGAHGLLAGEVPRSMALLLAMAAGGAGFALSAVLLRAPEWGELRARLARRPRT
jgi:putative peptidoglycan lipid II flippase